MFAGKSSAILTRVKRANFLGWKTMVLTCSIDNRYDKSGTKIMTHDLIGIDAIGVSVLKGVREMSEYSESRLIIIEEGQFFTDLYDFVVTAVETDGKDVVVVGLDGDSDRKPFGELLRLVPIADDITRLAALCKRCGDGSLALFTALVNGVKESQVCVGGADKYEPMCRTHYLENARNI
jgi:thymidine kinase